MQRTHATRRPAIWTTAVSPIQDGVTVATREVELQQTRRLKRGAQLHCQAVEVARLRHRLRLPGRVVVSEVVPRVPHRPGERGKAFSADDPTCHARTAT